MATTRAKTGNSKPRIVSAIEDSTKANTSKPRAKKEKVASGRVEKKPKTKTIHKKKSPAKQVKDKVEGKLEKAVGEVEGKPGKKAAGTRKEKPTTTKKIAAPKAKATKA